MPKWNLTRVLDLLQLERFADALDLIRAMPPEAARDPDVLLLSAVLLAHSGQLAAAAEVASRLLAIDELNAGAHYVLAMSLEGAGNRAAAINHDHVAVYLDPEFAMPRLHLGLLAKRAGDSGGRPPRIEPGAAPSPARGRVAALAFRRWVQPRRLDRALQSRARGNRRSVMIETNLHISDRAAELRHAFDRSFVEAHEVESVATEDFLAIHIGGDPYMLRLAEVAGLYADKKVTGLPSRIPELSGVAGFRGAMVPVYDLAALLRYPPSLRARWMVIAAEAPVAFAFDAFDGHLRFPRDAIASHVGSIAREHVRQIARTGKAVRPIVHIPSIIAAIRSWLPDTSLEKGALTDVHQLDLRQASGCGLRTRGIDAPRGLVVGLPEHRILSSKMPSGGATLTGPLRELAAFIVQADRRRDRSARLHHHGETAYLEPYTAALTEILASVRGCSRAHV